MGHPPENRVDPGDFKLEFCFFQAFTRILIPGTPKIKALSSKICFKPGFSCLKQAMANFFQP